MPLDARSRPPILKNSLTPARAPGVLSILRKLVQHFQPSASSTSIICGLLCRRLTPLDAPQSPPTNIRTPVNSDTSPGVRDVCCENWFNMGSTPC